jgi:two-component system chemotaxis response regulator CheB
MSNSFEAVVVGASAGGIRALGRLLAPLPSDFPLPIIVVQHLHPNSESYLPKILSAYSALSVKQAEERETIQNSKVYIAPPNYHLLIEEDHSFSLSLEPPVRYARPSIDVMFETAVYAYRDKLIGIILTGANDDGREGVKKIKRAGGYIIVQDPKTAEAEAMPKAAITAATVDKVLDIEEIGVYLLQFVNRSLRESTRS